MYAIKVEQFEHSTRRAIQRTARPLPMHNEIIIEATQNDENEILILIRKDGKIKGYVLEAAAGDVFHAKFGDDEFPPFLHEYEDCLGMDDYIMYAEANRADWKPEPQPEEEEE